MKTCKGDCLQCTPQQRVYCAAQMSRNAIDILNNIEKRLDSIDGRITELEKSDEADLFNPTNEETNAETETINEGEHNEASGATE